METRIIDPDYASIGEDAARESRKVSPDAVSETGCAPILEAAHDAGHKQMLLSALRDGSAPHPYADLPGKTGRQSRAFEALNGRLEKLGYRLVVFKYGDGRTLEGSRVCVVDAAKYDKTYRDAQWQLFEDYIY